MKNRPAVHRRGRITASKQDGRAHRGIEQYNEGHSGSVIESGTSGLPGIRENITGYLVAGNRVIADVNESLSKPISNAKPTDFCGYFSR